MGMKTILVLFIISIVSASYSQSDYYYTTGNNKFNLTKIGNQFTVEFLGNKPEGLHVPGTKLNDRLYIISDTSFLDSVTSTYFIHNGYKPLVGPDMYLTRNILLKFNPDVLPSRRNQIINDYGLTYVYSNRIYEQFECLSPLETSRLIYETGDVVFCHPDFIAEATLTDFIPNDEYFDEQYYLHNTGQTLNDGNIGTPGADIKAPAAWDLTKGDPSIIIAVIDKGVTSDHADLPNTRQVRLPGSNFAFNYDGGIFSADNPSPTPNNIDSYQPNHGNACAGIISATQDNNIGITGVAPLCKIMPIKIGFQIGLPVSAFANAIDFGTTNGAHILSNSWGWGYEANNVFPVITYTIETAINDGVIVIFAAGNTAANFVGGDGYTIFPANANIDGLITVGASDRYDMQAWYSPKDTEFEIVAPSNRAMPDHADFLGVDEFYDIWTIDTPENDGYNPWYNNDWPSQIPQGELLPMSSVGGQHKEYTGRFGGTSAAAPQVAGVAALMLSINPCMSIDQVKHYLQSTADKVGGYNYNINPQVPSRSNELGYGRLNAFDAVKAAQDHGAYPDLFIRDRVNDSGYDMGYPFTWDIDESPDIWVRNQNDGLINQIHENPNINSPTYVYVRVTNHSCSASSGLETVELHWTQATSSSSWPQNYNGSSPSIGNHIGSIQIPLLLPGEETILTFNWNVLDPTIHNNWNSCLMARIENEANDPIIIHPNDLASDIYVNNNVALRNTAVITTTISDPPVINGIKYPHGSFVYVGSSVPYDEFFDLILQVPENEIGNPITQEAEVTIRFDEVGWNIIKDYVLEHPDVKILEDNVILLLNPNVALNNIYFSAGVRIPIYIGFNFLTDELTSKNEFKLHVIQKKSFSDPTTLNSWTGGVHFTILKEPRVPFDADAGGDKHICVGEQVTLHATNVPEFVQYKWFDEDGSFICTGKDLTVSPNSHRKYKLQVTSEIDGFRDYDEINVNVDSTHIVLISPNPAYQVAVVDYVIANPTNATLEITNVINPGTFEQFALDINQSSFNLNVSNFMPGFYTIAIRQDGIIMDYKTLIVQ